MKNFSVCPFSYSIPFFLFFSMSCTSMMDSALNDNNIAAFRGAIQAGYPMDGRDRDGNTLLHRAASSGANEIVKELIGAGADTGAFNSRGSTPLQLAVYEGSRAPGARERYQNIVSMLIGAGASVTSKDQSSISIIDSSVIGYDIVIIRWLLEKGARFSHRYGLFPMISALIIGGRLHNSVGLSDADKVEIAEIMVQHGASINETDEDGKTPLITAAFYGDSAIAEFLLKKGCAIDSVDKTGATALQIALQRSSFGVADLIRKYSASRP